MASAWLVFKQMLEEWWKSGGRAVEELRQSWGRAGAELGQMLRLIIIDLDSKMMV